MRYLKVSVFSVVIIIVSTLAIISTSAGYSNKQSKSQSEVSVDTPDIPTYANDAAGRPYVVIGKMSIGAVSVPGALRKLARQAANAGADALLNYSVEQTYFVTATGIAVRWAKDGEKGITSIGPGTPNQY